VHDSNPWARLEADRFARYGKRHPLLRDDEDHQPTQVPGRKAISSADADAELAQRRWEIARLRLDWELLKLALRAQKANFKPSQPRDDRGRWTDTEHQTVNDPRVISEASPYDRKPGSRYAQIRGPIFVRVGGRVVSVEGGQAARLVEAQARAEMARAHVREVDPTWRPRPSSYETVEGLIRTYNAEAREAQDRVRQLAQAGIGPGHFARESIRARSPDTDFTAAERNEMNRIGRAFGCHTCGSLEPGTGMGNFVLDHQPPTALNTLGREQRLYPQCRSCSFHQGGNVNKFKLGH
jgi:hypothetical protein